MIGNFSIDAIRRLDGGLDYAASWDGDTDYPTGGTLAFTTLLRDAIKAAALAASDRNVRGPETVTILDVQGGDCGVYQPAFVRATGALKVLDAAGAEAALHADLHATRFHALVVTD
jgi:hypothetical protein